MDSKQSLEATRAAIIRLMGNKSYLRPSSLLEALIKETGESLITIRQSLARLSSEKWLDGVTMHGEPIGQVRIIGQLPEQPPNPDLEQWEEVLASAGLQPSDKSTLSPLYKAVAGFDRQDQRHILDGLLCLRENLEKEYGRHRFVVSAQYLLGSSKLLSKMPGSALKAFGIETDRFPGHPLYVVAGGATAPKAVVLVENPAAFESAMSSSAVKTCAFIATFGFGLSKSEEDYGEQLAYMIKDRFKNSITLTRDGSVSLSARDLLQHPKITFWGDLDPAGVQIYLHLKQRVRQLELSALYQPMSALVNDPRYSHPYVATTGKAGQTSMQAICPDHEEKARWLLGLCQNRGVDQEAVSLQDIGHYAGKAL